MIPLSRMRWIDRWLGVPLLWCVGGWLWLKRAVRLSRHDSTAVDSTAMDSVATTRSQPRVLTLLLSEMGSLILAEPALRQLQQGSQAQLGLCLFQRNRECLQLLPALQQLDLFVIRDHSLRLLLWDVWRFRRWCRQHRFDAVIDMELFSRFSGWLSVLSGAPLRSGFDSCANEGLYRGALLTHPVWYNPHQHMANNYLTLVEAVVEGLAVELSEGLGDSNVGSGLPYVKTPLASELPQPTPFVFDSNQQALVEQQLAAAGIELPPQLDGTRLLINVAGSDLIAQRNWPVSSQVELCRLLLSSDPYRQILLCGNEAQRTLTRRIVQLVDDPRCQSVAGLLLLPQLPYLYRRSALMVTPDSGPAHFAAVTPMPVLVLFGPETPVLYRPLGVNRVLSAGLRCSPCVSAANHRHTLCLDNQCMALISAEQVHQQVQEMLAAAADEPVKTADLITLVPQSG